MNSEIATIAERLMVPRNFAVVADDPTTRQFLGMIIEYVGSQASCLITTASNNSIASAVGAAGAEAADANFTVGSTPGTIDLTNAASNTMGEVVDFINGLADYKARLVGLRRADDADTTAALVAVTSQQAKVKGGLGLAIDTSVADQVSVEISVLDGKIANGATEGQVGTDSDSKRAAQNFLRRVDGTLTYSGADVFEVIEVDDAAQSDRVIYSNTISAVLAASTSAGTEDFTNAGLSQGLASDVGKRLILRLRAATSIAITNLNVIGATKVLS